VQEREVAADVRPVGPRPCVQRPLVADGGAVHALPFRDERDLGGTPDGAVRQRSTQVRKQFVVDAVATERNLPRLRRTAALPQRQAAEIGGAAEAGAGED